MWGLGQSYNGDSANDPARTGTAAKNGLHRPYRHALAGDHEAYEDSGVEP